MAVTDKVRLDLDGPIATITNANVEKQNAFDDEMDARLWEILDELKRRPGLRVVIWRAEGKSWSSGRDVSAIGTLTQAASHHELSGASEATLWLYEVRLTARRIAKDTPGLFGGWIIHKEGFRAPKVLDVARLQAWTLKPALVDNERRQ